ncbi:DUF1178 family protein [Dechloromonas sp. ZY10]|uniref:DUF1178 family protein n=1 Tax=Dechloromonas aquae TaxID=2664436 RepID=UPI0035287341
MIIYDLCCAQDHRFEGWFRDAADFDRQLQEGLLLCPHCAERSVRRVPSAVAIGSSPRAVVPPADRADQRTTTHSSIPPSLSELKAAYRQVMQQMLAGSEDLGRGFAAEARRIHYHEAPERPIHGQASADECAALHDEGIAVLPLPALDPNELN